MERPWQILPDADPWSDNAHQKLKREILSHELLWGTKLDYVNVLLVGQISAGKSSFYNTVESVFGNYVTTKADVGALDKSLTTQLRYYKVKAKDENNKPIRFRFCDTMGLEAGDAGLRPKDLARIMDGHVKDGTDLSKGISKWDSSYNPSPTKNDKMHAVAFIVDASFAYMDEEIFKKFQELRQEARDRGLNPMILLSKIDVACKELSKDDGDITNVFHSRTIKEKVEQVAEKFGVAENMVFPIQNYNKEWEKVTGMDILILRVLRQILRHSESALDDLIDKEEVVTKQPGKTMNKGMFGKFMTRGKK